MISKVGSLSCPLCDSSLVHYMARQKRERRGRRRTIISDQAESRAVPAVELEPDSDLLFQNLTDLIVSAIAYSLEEEKPRLEDVVKEIGERRYFDSMSQAFIAPANITRDHVAFIITHDPVVRCLYKIEDGIVVNVE